MGYDGMAASYEANCLTVSSFPSQIESMYPTISCCFRNWKSLDSGDMSTKPPGNLRPRHVLLLILNSAAQPAECDKSEVIIRLFLCKQVGRSSKDVAGGATHSIAHEANG